MGCYGSTLLNGVDFVFSVQLSEKCEVVAVVRNLDGVEVLSFVDYQLSCAILVGGNRNVLSFGLRSGTGSCELHEVLLTCCVCWTP